MKLTDRLMHSLFFHPGAGEKGGLAHLLKEGGITNNKNKDKIKQKSNIQCIIGGKHT